MGTSTKKPVLLTPELEAYIEREHARQAAETTRRTIHAAKLREAWGTAGGRAFRRFVETRPSPATRRVYEQHLDDYLLWIALNAGGIDVLDASPEDLARYERDVAERVSTRSNQRLSLRTRQDRVRTVRTAYKFCVDEELLDRSPARHLRVRGRSEPKRTFLSDSAATALVEACRGEALTDVRDESLVVFLLHTGLRAAEAAALTWDCLSKPPNVSVTVEGKGRVVRTVPVSDQAYKTLRRWSAELRSPRGSDCVWSGIEHRIGRGGRSSGTSGSLTVTSLPLAPGTVYAIVRKRASRAGLENVTPHTLRRTYATKLKRLGVALDTIQRYLGHASILTTAGYFDPHDEGALALVRDLDYKRPDASRTL
jgi:integrase/recombinase XerD